MEELEDVFEVLNRIVALGDTLTKVYVIDEGNRTDLPPDAFDGSAFSSSLQRMEHQWQHALCEPERAHSSEDQELIGWTKQRETMYQSTINTHQLMIQRLERLLQRTTHTLYPGSDTDRLVEHYQTLISSSQNQLSKARLGLATVVKRLQQLGL
ncbi:hypothetical protein [Spirosoma agri]|uniref:Uncharacterized protein n=1 Tax=Spirosoma agri TaxID=1987381 RepID=A0A6M0IM61_9BACT|nr:hypothetical protein [Spirosoma agri]NEU67973.1 hypothetical protein [Spirosoma agri]